jgi:protein-S-isoprenylcysteine O-methyltransferase Ste14
MTFNLLVAFATAVWLISCGASLLALSWNLTADGKRWRGALIASSVALLTSCFGLYGISFKASRTTNGEVVWSFNSKWFFLAALVLAVASLALGLRNWRRARARRSLVPPPIPPAETEAQDGTGL